MQCRGHACRQSQESTTARSMGSPHTIDSQGATLEPSPVRHTNKLHASPEMLVCHVRTTFETSGGLVLTATAESTAGVEGPPCIGMRMARAECGPHKRGSSSASPTAQSSRRIRRQWNKPLVWKGRRASACACRSGVRHNQARLSVRFPASTETKRCPCTHSDSGIDRWCGRAAVHRHAHGQSGVRPTRARLGVRHTDSTEFATKRCPCTNSDSGIDSWRERAAVRRRVHGQ